MPQLDLSAAELNHIRNTIKDAIEELQLLHASVCAPGEDNYYARELQDCLVILDQQDTK